MRIIKSFCDCYIKVRLCLDIWLRFYNIIRGYINYYKGFKSYLKVSIFMVNVILINYKSIKVIVRVIIFIWGYIVILREIEIFCVFLRFLCVFYK